MNTGEKARQDNCNKEQSWLTLKERTCLHEGCAGYKISINLTACGGMHAPLVSAPRQTGGLAPRSAAAAGVGVEAGHVKPGLVSTLERNTYRIGQFNCLIVGGSRQSFEAVMSYESRQREGFTREGILNQNRKCRVREAP